jgi:SAM-dependent methyltransferase
VKQNQRTPEKIREHYEIEKQLAQRLRNSDRQERRTLYTCLYDELFASVPHHPQLTRKSSPAESAREVAYQIRHLQSFLKRDTVFLEIGPGDCALSFKVAKLVKTVYAIDVSEKITKNLAHPPNFKLVLSDGTSIPIPANSIDVAYSNQLMEHLHPDDALEQLRNIYDALAPGGIYICITPNRLYGPHDISRHFDTVATGFHLKEYTVTELDHLFRATGFSRVRTFVPVKELRVFLPVFAVKLCEKALSALPHSLKRSLASSWLGEKLLGIRLVGSVGSHKVVPPLSTEVTGSCYPCSRRHTLDEEGSDGQTRTANDACRPDEISER